VNYGVVVGGGARSHMRHLKIHGCSIGGVQILGAATLEDSEVFGNDGNGVGIGRYRAEYGAEATLRRNRIYQNKKFGVAADNASGTLEDNNIFENGWSGVEIGGSTNLQLYRNRINRNEGVGVKVDETGRGIAEDNDLTGNEMAAWSRYDEPRVIRARNKE
jgi:F-box protein 11